MTAPQTRTPDTNPTPVAAPMHDADYDALPVVDEDVTTGVNDHASL